MKIVLAILHILLICFLSVVLAKRWNAIKSKLYWLSFALHVIAGISVGLVYLHYYAANDTWFFFDDAKKISSIAHEDLVSYLRVLFDFSDDQIIPGVADRDFRSLIFIKVLSLLSLVTWDNYWTSTIYFSFFSFISSWFLFKKIVDHFDHSKPAAALAFLFFPSVIFWSSGIEKESVTLTALYFLVGIFLQVFTDRKVDKLVLVLVIFAGAILWALKYYWAGVFFIAAITAFLVQYFSKRSAYVKGHPTYPYVVIFVAVGLMISFLHPNFYLNRFLEVVVDNHNAFVSFSNDNNLIHFYQLNPTISSVMINSPWALISGVLRPFLGEGQGALGLAASVENLLILGLCATCLWNFKTYFDGPVHILTLTVVSYCIVLCIFLALSTPNLGTLSRYRVGFLPFLVFILAYRNPVFDKVTRRFVN